MKEYILITGSQGLGVKGSRVSTAKAAQAHPYSPGWPSRRKEDPISPQTLTPALHLTSISARPLGRGVFFLRSFPPPIQVREYPGLEPRVSAGARAGYPEQPRRRFGRCSPPGRPQGLGARTHPL